MGHFRKRIHGDGLLSALGFVVSGAFLMGLLGSLHWFFDLFSHFRMQYLVILLCVVGYFGVRKRYIHLIVFGIFLVVTLATILPLYIGTSRPGGGP